MFGKLLTHLRDQRSKQSSLFHFTEEDLQQPSEDSNITAKDLTKYIYGVAKGMEYIVSKNVRLIFREINLVLNNPDTGLLRNSQLIGHCQVHYELRFFRFAKHSSFRILYLCLFEP